MSDKHTSDVSSVNYQHVITSSCDSGIGLCSSYHSNDFPETATNLISSCNEDNLTETCTSVSVENSLCCTTPITCTNNDCDEINCTPNHESSDLQSHMTQLMINVSKAAAVGSHATSSSAVLLSLTNTDNAYESSQIATDHCLQCERKYPNSASTHKLDNDSR